MIDTPNYGPDRNGPWEKEFLYTPTVIDDKLVWWVYAERRWVVKKVDGRPVAYYEWRMP